MGVREVAWDFVRGLVGEGIGANEIQRRLIGSGLGYRRAVMLADISVLHGRQISERALRSFAKDFVPPVGYTTAHRKEIKQRFLYEFEITGRNLITGEEETRSASTYYDRAQRIGEAEGEAIDRYITNESDPTFEIDRAELISIWDKQKKLP